MNDELGDELKTYEDKTRLESDKPIIARLDGKNFHAWTRKLKKPFDPQLSQLMRNTTTYLMTETNAQFGYTQSDEISLTWLPKGNAEPFMGGKVQKMVSVLASMCSSYFNMHKSELNPSVWGTLALFDARVFSIYNEDRGGDYFLWRYLDAQKNAISAAAYAHLSHKQLEGRGSGFRLQALSDMGIDFNEYPDYFRQGTFYKKVPVIRRYTTEELDKLPPKHEAKTNPNLMVQRHEIKKVNEYIPEESRPSVYWTEFVYRDEKNARRKK